MNAQIRVQQMLIRKFTDMKVKNPSISMRAFAARIGMQPGATNEIMKGQRRVSRALAEKLADKLLLDPSERTDLLNDFTAQIGENVRENDLNVLKLKADEFALISDWVHFALLSLMKVKGFKSDIAWMADRLNLPTNEVRKALLRLQHLNLVNQDANGNYTRSAQPIRTTDDVLDISLQRMHVNDMEMAKEKISSVPVKERDYTNFTFPADPKAIKRAKEIIRKAQDDIEAIMETSDATEVYRVCMYLFPLTVSENSTGDICEKTS